MREARAIGGALRGMRRPYHFAAENEIELVRCVRAGAGGCRYQDRRGFRRQVDRRPA